MREAQGIQGSKTGEARRRRFGQDARDLLRRRDDGYLDRDETLDWLKKLGCNYKGALLRTASAENGRALEHSASMPQLFLLFSTMKRDIFGQLKISPGRGCVFHGV